MSPTHRLAVTAGLGLLVLTATPPTRASNTARVVNVSQHGGNQAETAVAINPTDPSNIVITSNLASFFGLMKSVSFDGGRSWTNEVVGDGDRLGSICCDSSLAFDTPETCS